MLDRAELNRLFAQLADGDRSSFEPAFRLVLPLLRDFVGRRLRDAEAEDVVQEAMMKLFSNAHRFDRSLGDAASYAVAYASYELRTLRKSRARSREDSGSDLTAHPTVSRGPEEEAMQRELAETASEVLGTLRAQDQETILAAISGEKPSLAAATFRKRLQRSMERLREAWSMKNGLL